MDQYRDLRNRLYKMHTEELKTMAMNIKCNNLPSEGVQIEKINLRSAKVHLIEYIIKNNEWLANDYFDIVRGKL